MKKSPIIYKVVPLGNVKMGSTFKRHAGGDCVWVKGYYHPEFEMYYCYRYGHPNRGKFFRVNLPAFVRIR